MPHLLEHDLEYVAKETEGLWEQLKGHSLFLTGGTGFVGTWLIETFARANRKYGLNARVVVLSRHPEAFRTKAPEAVTDSSVQFLQGSLTDFLFPTGEFRYIVHAATDQVIASREEPTGTFDRDVAGTRRVLELAHRTGTKRLLFASSGAVYGKQPLGMTHIPEEYCGAPLTTDSHSGYGQAKRVSEFLCTMFGRQYGIDPVIGRLFAFAGPHLPTNLNFAVGNFVGDVLNGGPVRIHGDGNPIRSYLYAADLAVWLWKLLLQGEPARPYNVGSDLGISIRDLAQVVVDTCAPGMPIEVAQPSSGDSSVSQYVPCVDRARAELNLEAKIPLVEAIRRMYLWNRATSRGLSSP